jgi:Ca2+-binding EF-hand superfamily protein
VLDSDGDGKLDLDELEAALRPVLSKRGGNGGSGGSVGGVPPSLVAVAALRKHDRDGDGRVSLPEFRSLLLSAAGGK